MSTPFSAQFPDAAEAEDRLDQTAQVPAYGDEPTGGHPAAQGRPATVEHVTTAQEPPALAVFLFQAACWILAVAVFFLLFCGIKALWDGFLFGA